MTAAQHMQVRMQGVSCSTTNPVPAMVPLNCERSRNYAANNLANPHGLQQRYRPHRSHVRTTMLCVRAAAHVLPYKDSQHPSRCRDPLSAPKCCHLPL